MIPTLQTKIQGLQRNVQRAESDARFKAEEATKYQNQVYSLQVELEGLSARLGEEVQTLKDRLKLIEGERDALKTSLKEEEVLRIAAEGQIPLPTATNDEEDDFGSPVRSPRKQRNISPYEDDKENVAPKKLAVELRFLQQELTSEKRLRERAQDQIEFMKMECQFQCCSCRIAELKGANYVHDNTYEAEMDRIKTSVPILTPPPSSHEEDVMKDIIIKQEPVEEQRPVTPPIDMSPPLEQNEDNTVLTHPQTEELEANITYSPTSGTFKSPKKVDMPRIASTPPKASRTNTPVEQLIESSPWTPDAHSTMIPIDAANRGRQQENKAHDIDIHEDAVESEEESEPPTPMHEPSGPATPYFTRTITTTTTIPLHFSPATPALKPGAGPMTPSTVAHAPANARTPVLGELNLNNLPFDREAALEAIRQRRGRARSMAIGHGTPMKQMVEGVKDRRDISAPVSRVRR